MSRIGKLPVQLPGGVTVKVDENNVVAVKGPKGELTQKIHKDIKVAVGDGLITITRPTDSKPHKSLHGLSRSLINNMVEGVTKGFQKNLELNGVGYRAQLQGKKLVLIVGYSHPVEIEAEDGIEFEVPTPNKIIVRGIDKQRVGAVAANVQLQGKKLVLIVGYSHPVEIEAEDGIEFEVPTPNKIIVRGIDKQRVGAVAANVRRVREPEPYKGKGIKYEDERIIRKEGKTGK